MHDTARQLAKQFADKYILTPFADVLDVGGFIPMQGRRWLIMPGALGSTVIWLNASSTRKGNLKIL